MTNILSLSRAEYLGDINDIRYIGGVVVSALTADPSETANDALHYHENPIISFILEGDSIERINHDTNHRSAGDIRFYRAGDLHQVKINRFPSRNINFELENQFFENYELTENAIHAAIENSPYAKAAFLRLYQELQTPDIFSRSSIQMLLFDLIGDDKDLENDKKPDWVSVIYEILNDRWNEPVTLQELSLAINFHPVTISKYFAKYFNCTFGDYMRRIRINKSISLIKNSSLSLTETAFQCGFSDHSHFTRTFKEITGFLPKDLKKF